MELRAPPARVSRTAAIGLAILLASVIAGRLILVEFVGAPLLMAVEQTSP
jgi:hypothetical protein